MREYGIMSYIIELMKEFARQGFPCLFRRITGLYCPGCGGTRAVLYLLRGNIGRSLWYHPLVGYMAAVLAAEAGSRIWMSRGKGGDREAEKRMFLGNYEAEIYVGIGIIAANWVIKNGVLLAAGVKLIP